jgi:uncharacterized damage-inducible protein DinB
MMSHCRELADQIRRAFEGEAWHGDSLNELLRDLSAKTASAHPVPGAHSIWELVLHITAWDDAVVRRAQGSAVNLSDSENFPPVTDSGLDAWRAAQNQARKIHEQLVEVVATFPDSRLQEQVPGKTESYYTFYYMFSGIVQHELYHAGQIALLKKFA